MAKQCKKLTREQRHMLQSEGINDTENWVYVKTLQIPFDESKGLSKKNKKLIQLLFENIQTGQQVAISIGGYK